MQAVVRKYSGQGAKELMDVLEKNVADVERQMRSVSGFVSYTLVRTAEGGVAVTVCRDQAGVDESTRKAKEWVAQHAAHVGAAAPEVAAGSVLLQAH